MPPAFSLVPWTSRRRRFQANLRALAMRGVDAVAIQAAWDDPAQGSAQRYQLYQATDGNFHILDTHAKAEAQWLGGLQDFKSAVSDVKAESFKGHIRAPLAFDGIGHGWLIPHILEISEQSYLNYSAPLYVVEPDVISFAIALHLQDLQPWLAGPRLRLFVGDGALVRFEKALRENVGWTLPGNCIFNPLRQRETLNLQAAVERVQAMRSQARGEALERIQAHYAAFEVGHWPERFSQVESAGTSQKDIGNGAVVPLRVLGITTRFSTVLRYSMEELQAAAATCGIPMHMEICIEQDDQSLEKDYIGMIDRLKPDLIVSISRMRHEVPDIPRNIPALCWDQDNLQCMRDPAALADLQGLTFVAGHGAVFGSMHLGWPLPACIFCHLAGMTHRYQPAAPSADESARFGADISYVSHAAGTPEQLRAQLRTKWAGSGGGSVEFAPLFDDSSGRVIAAMQDGQCLEFVDYMELMRDTAEKRGLMLPQQVSGALLIDLRLIADRAFRHQTLEWVARWCETRGKRLRIWGNGWHGHPTLAKWAAGVALPGEQAQAVFRASCINLQIIETGVLHSRLLDGWAAGGFFLIRQAHRSQDEQRIEDCYQIGLLTERESIDTIGDLEDQGSVELRRLWNRVASGYANFDRGRCFPGFRMWRSLVPAHTLMPQLREVTFRDAAEFEKSADHFSADAEARSRMLASIRGTLQEHLSYDARWREFVRHMAGNLCYAPAGHQVMK